MNSSLITDASIRSSSPIEKPSFSPDIANRLGSSLLQGSISLPQTNIQVPPTLQSPSTILETSGLQKASTTSISQRLGPETAPNVSQWLVPETAPNVSQRLGPETSPNVSQRLGPETSPNVIHRLGPPVPSNFKVAAPHLLSAVPQRLQSSKSSSPTRSVTLKDMNQNSLGSPSSPSSASDSPHKPSAVTSEKPRSLNSSAHSDSVSGKPVKVKTSLHSAHQDVGFETLRTASPINDVPSPPSVGSLQSLATGAAVPTTSRRHYGQLSQALPIHPQVVVPLGSSDSEDDDEQGDGFQRKKALGETSEQEVLRKQEIYLSMYRQKIEEDQEMVKQLVNKAVKFQ
ncbi:unnamed protein product, partial [Lymnaea stagnalis]